MIEVKNLSFSYGREPLFSDLDLSAAPGSIYGLLGKNGAGKTTLLKLLSGMRFPKGGECLVMGQKPGDRLPLFLQELFLVPEAFNLPSVTMMKYEKLYAPFYPRFDASGFHGYLEELELDPKKNLKACSYGQKKKFFLAFGFACGCRLMLLDEPTNGLDIPSKSSFRKIIASLLAGDRLFVISAHQVRDLENLIDSVIILDKGRIIFNQSMTEISHRLSVNLRQQRPAEGEALHVENIMGQYAVVTENRDGEETEESYAWMTLPASILEKYASRAMLTSVGYFLLITIWYTLSAKTLEGVFQLKYGQEDIPFNTFDIAFNPFDSVVVDYFAFYLVIHSMVLVGAVYFRRLAYVIVLLIIYELATFAMIPIIDHGITMAHLEAIKVIARFPFWWLIVPICWIWGYYLLKRTTV